MCWNWVKKETETLMTVEAVQEKLENRAISRSASMVILGGIFSVLVGFFNQLIIAAYFGAGAGMDAYLTATVVPAYFQVVLLTGLSFVFVPAFVREETKGNKEAAWELVGTFFWTTAVILVAVAIVGFVFSKEIIALIAPGFSAEKSMLSARMLSVLMLSVPFSGLGSFTLGVQNSRGSFFWPSFAGALNSLGSILGVVLLTGWIGPMALAWGFLIAILLQSSVTIVPVLRHGWSKPLPLTDRRILEMGRLILPFLVFGLLTRGTGIFERYFASSLTSGQLSYLGYAGKISHTFHQLVAVGIAAAIFPAMARSYTQRGNRGLEEKAVYGLRLTMSVALPTVLITGAVSIPLVSFLYQRGRFLPADSYYVAQIVLIEMLNGVLIVMLTNIITRAYYVLKDTLTPSLISVFCIVLYISIGQFFADRWGYVGLAYASLIRSAVSVFILYILLVKKLPGISMGRTAKVVFVYIVAAIGAYLVGSLLAVNLAFLPRFLNLILSVLMSGSFYLVVLYFFDREILHSIMEMLGSARFLELAKNVKSYLRRVGVN
jgi:putative peptidoglycan lipid II flippase